MPLLDCFRRCSQARAGQVLGKCSIRIHIEIVEMDPREGLAESLKVASWERPIASRCLVKLVEDACYISRMLAV
jgi:hypothetical protein